MRPGASPVSFDVTAYTIIKHPSLCKYSEIHEVGPSRLHHALWHHLHHLPALPTRPPFFVLFKPHHSLLDLRPQIRTVKGRFMHHLTAVLTVPPQPILAVCRPGLLDHDPYRVGEADGVMRRVGGQEEHLAFADRDVAVGAGVDDFEEHAAAVLVEPFGGLVDVVVCSGVGAADDLGGLAMGLGNSKGERCHDCDILVVDAVVVDWRFEEVGVLFEPSLVISKSSLGECI